VASRDFEALARSALAAAPALLKEWMGGKSAGKEWKAERTKNGGIGDSWTVNLNDGTWMHGAGDEKGGDLTSLYAALNHISNTEAYDALAPKLGINGYAAPVLADKPSRKCAAEPIPENAPEPPPDPERGAQTVYWYGSSFAVVRYDPPDGKKTFRQFTWRNGKWAAVGPESPKELYNLQEIQSRPALPVLVVEGEKCAELAFEHMPMYVATTWAGGASAVDKTDWMPLRDRDVYVWPDADGPGRKAAIEIIQIVSQFARRVYSIVPEGKPDKWDLADAIAEDLPLTDWVGANLKLTFDRDAPKQDLIPKNSAPNVRNSSVLINWADMGLDCKDDGKPYVTMANVSQIIQDHPNFKGRVWYDSFRERIYHTLFGAEPIPWTDDYDLELTYQLQRALKLHKFSIQIVRDGVQHAAWRNRRNSLTDWLDTLKWDGRERLEHWLADVSGCERNEYTTAISHNWPLAMVSRAYNPGTKMDIMVVLEGKQGAGKSTFLEVLGGEWYKALTMNFGEKDFLMAIQGAWIVEIPDMAGFSKSEHSKIISTTSIRVDEFRKSYGRNSESKQRKCLFAATSETSDYLQSSKGGRRFWPVACADHVDTDALKLMRDDVLAEAIVRMRNGAEFHRMPESAEDEQRARVSIDLWAEPILIEAESLLEIQERTGSDMHITSSLLLKQGVGVELSHQTDQEKKRVAAIMHDAGWVQKRSAHLRRWIKPKRM
jgi:putative DNA primase/helicase